MINCGLVAEALESYDADPQAAMIESAEVQRGVILERFPRDAWPTMTLNEYAHGQTDHPESFCRRMEFRTSRHAVRPAARGLWGRSDKLAYKSVIPAGAMVRLIRQQVYAARSAATSPFGSGGAIAFAWRRNSGTIIAKNLAAALYGAYGPGGTAARACTERPFGVTEYAGCRPHTLGAAYNRVLNIFKTW